MSCRIIVRFSIVEHFGYWCVIIFLRIINILPDGDLLLSELGVQVQRIGPVVLDKGYEEAG